MKLKKTIDYAKYILIIQKANLLYSIPEEHGQKIYTLILYIVTPCAFSGFFLCKKNY